MSKKKTKKLGINLNRTVYVKLTKKAKAIYYDKTHRENVESFISQGYSARLDTKKEEDPDGFSKFQLWEFMNFFQTEVFGQDLPTIDGNIYFNRSDLSPLDLKEGENK
jgi:hypothetical protein